MVSNKNWEALNYPQQTEQGKRYQDECYNEDYISPSVSECSNEDIHLLKEAKNPFITTNVNKGTLNSTIKETGLKIGDILKYKKQMSGCNYFYHCMKCDEQFFDMDGLNHHFTLFHSKDNTYACGSCEKWFRFKKSLVKHIKKYDFKCVAKRLRMKKVIKSDREENLSKLTNSKAEVLVLEKTELLKSPKSLVEGNPNTLEEKCSEWKRYLCCHCGASFDGKVCLKGHLDKCPRIGNEFNQNLPKKQKTVSHTTNITSNANNIDPGIWYKCVKCNETFPDRKHVICHLKEKHNAEKPYMCSMCNVGFCSRLEVGLHQTVHKGQKPYTCKTCGAGFAVNYSFKNHIKSCEDKSIFFKCNICGKCFGTESGLKKHSITHSLERKYACKYCPDRFKVLSTMNSHVSAVHLKIKPYECGVCRKTFAQKSILYYHTACHSDERPFVCDVCGRGFKLKFDLVKHKKRMHSSYIQVPNDNLCTI